MVVKAEPINVSQRERDPYPNQAHSLKFHEGGRKGDRRLNSVLDCGP